MLWYRLPLLFALAAIARAALLQPTFSSCENYYATASGINRLNVSDIYAEIIPGSQAAPLGLTGEGADVLRLDLIGVVGSEVIGYDNGTNKLGGWTFTLLLLEADGELRYSRIPQSAVYPFTALRPGFAIRCSLQPFPRLITPSTPLTALSLQDLSVSTYLYPCSVITL